MLLLTIRGESKSNIICGLKLNLVTTYHLRVIMKILQKYYRHNTFLSIILTNKRLKSTL